MAWFPSYRAPHPSELLEPGPFTPPGPPPLTAHGRRLLDAVLADPDSDGPRLAVADWYDAQGDPRGEFIRVQLQLAQRPTPALRAREQDLLLANGSRWVADFRPWSADDVVFRRGFAESMSLAGRAFLSISDGLFRSTPLRDVRLVAVVPYLDELATSPFLAKLRRLDLSGNRIGPDGIRMLARSPYIRGLKHLDLSRNDLGSDGTAVLSDEWPSRLESLALSGNGLNGEDIRTLLSSPRMQSLVDLDVSRNPVGPALVKSGFLDRAVRLGLGFTGLTTADVREMARSGARPMALDLSFNDLGDEAVRELAGSEMLSECESLNLRGNRLTRGEGLRPASVTRLDLSVNPLGDAGVGTGWPGLIDLRLVNVLLTSAGLERLAAGGGMVGLERLDLGGNNLGDAGTKVLAGCPDLGGLRELDLTATDLGFAGAVALARSPTLTGLRTLSVGQNPRLPPDGLEMLRERFSELRPINER